MEGRKEREVHAPGTTHSRDKDGGAEGAGSATGEKDSKRRRETLTVLAKRNQTHVHRQTQLHSQLGRHDARSDEHAIQQQLALCHLALDAYPSDSKDGRSDSEDRHSDSEERHSDGEDAAQQRRAHEQHHSCTPAAPNAPLTHTYQLAAIAKTRTQRTGNFRNYWPIRARCPGSSSRLVYLARCRSRCVGLWRGRRRRVLRGLRGGGRRALASGNGEEALARGCGGGSVGERGWVWDKKVVERGGEEWKA
ncbi:hypothetical protein EXIGLDRAFT_412789 [Exidia glandulosa HHB12029]|uniref:Uncharacterized protein n=1 Tax=Exidia glandulosa HHB12029 TaxID=1314781 RepID=A0A165BFB1_EXIGL|nr:hypothetical protein EXIGLDRAFT_412789 [Exidia glandulosa HHB12029]